MENKLPVGSGDEVEPMAVDESLIIRLRQLNDLGLQAIKRAAEARLLPDKD